MKVLLLLCFLAATRAFAPQSLRTDNKWALSYGVNRNGSPYSRQGNGAFGGGNEFGGGSYGPHRYGPLDHNSNRGRGGEYGGRYPQMDYFNQGGPQSRRYPMEQQWNSQYRMNPYEMGMGGFPQGNMSGPGSRHGPYGGQHYRGNAGLNQWYQRNSGNQYNQYYSQNGQRRAPGYSQYQNMQYSYPGQHQQYGQQGYSQQGYPQQQPQYRQQY